MDDFRPVRVGAIPGRHRGGWLDSWQAYAEWLEQLVADDGRALSGETFESLPRERRINAFRSALRESRLPRERRRPR